MLNSRNYEHIIAHIKSHNKEGSWRQCYQNQVCYLCSGSSQLGHFKCQNESFLILCAKVSKPNDPSYTVAILYCVKYKENVFFFDGLPKRSCHGRGEQPPHHLYEVNSTTTNTSSRKLLSCVSWRILHCQELLGPSVLQESSWDHDHMFK